MDENKKLILHICCAPDATVREEFRKRVCTTGFFMAATYIPRKSSSKGGCGQIPLSGIGCRIMEYDPQTWISATEGSASEPEGGKRCPLCFELQLRAAAGHAAEMGAAYLTTTLTISPHKDPQVINKIGEKVASEHGLQWIHRIWRKNDGFRRSVEESRSLGLYRQDYCGCIYSIRNR